MQAARFRFSIRQIMVVTFVYGLLFAWLGTLPIPGSAFAAAICTASFFVALDLGGSRIDPTNAPLWSRVTLFAARYATAFALAAMVCLVVSAMFPSKQPPRPPLPFLAELYEFLSGQWLQEAFKPLIVALHLMVAYLAFSIGGFFAALVAVRRIRSACWFLVLNSPAIVLVAWSIVEPWFSGLAQ